LDYAPYPWPDSTQIRREKRATFAAFESAACRSLRRQRMA
jgi:hypothetical protein